LFIVERPLLIGSRKREEELPDRIQGRQSWGVGRVATPRFWAGVVGVAGGREILL